MAVGTEHPEALDLAQNLGSWLDSRLHEPEFGGWFEVCDADGDVEFRAQPRFRRSGRLGAPFGLKVQNAHLHVVEGFTELCEANPTPRNRELVEETAGVFVDRMWSWPGALLTLRTRGWKPGPRACSFGHDVEGGFLVLDAARALGRPGDPPRRRVRSKRRPPSDRRGPRLGERRVLRLRRGDGARLGRTQRVVDSVRGPERPRRLGPGRRPHADQVKTALRLQGRWVRDFQVDSEYGGSFAWTAPDGRPVGPLAKGHPWKSVCHEGRALMNAVPWLRASDRPEAPGHGEDALANGSATIRP